MGKALWTETFPEQVKKRPQRKREQKPRKRVNPMSKKRQAQSREYVRKAAEFKRRNQSCKAGIASNCSHKTKDVHHQRGRVGSLLLDQRYWIPVCRECHDWIGANPQQARAAGLICEAGKWNSQRD